MPPDPDPVRPADDSARTLARDLLAQARFAALSYLDAGKPGIARIALAPGPLTLISDLSQHTRALRENPACAVMVGEPGEKGDPLTHPRLMLQANARFVPDDAPDRAALRAAWLAIHPKARLYIDFADFSMVRLDATGALLNAGFGKAFRLTAADLRA